MNLDKFQALLRAVVFGASFALSFLLAAWCTYYGLVYLELIIHNIMSWWK